MKGWLNRSAGIVRYTHYFCLMKQIEVLIPVRQWKKEWLIS